MSSLDLVKPKQPASGETGASTSTSGAGKTYWRSLDELADAPEFQQFVQREFPAYAEDMLKPTSRRNFLKIMGASIALAGMTACRWPREEILPFTRRPADYVPGNPIPFATTMDVAGIATGLLVTTYDGRPVKVEGNPGHPSSLGSTDIYHQAAVLGLYDPDRSDAPVENSGGQVIYKNWDDVHAALGSAMAAKRGSGSGLAVLAGSSSSPTRRALKRRFMEVFPSATWHEYEATSRDHEREGLRQAFGAPMRALPKFDRAQVVVSLDDDFLFDHPTSVANNKHFFRARRPDAAEYNRLYTFEAAHTVTGGMADHRMPTPAREIGNVAGCLAAALFLDHHLEIPLPEADASALSASLRAFRDTPLFAKVEPAAEDLLAHRGHGLVTVGPEHAPETHALVALINVALAGAGETVVYVADPDTERPHHLESIRELTDAMNGGRVDTLLILGGNPVFDAPADVKFGDALSKVANSIHLSLYRDETSNACSWHLPAAHFLESWGDAMAWDGTLSVVQPLITPLYDGKSEIELLAASIGDGPVDGYEIVRSVWTDAFGADGFETTWRTALHDGMVSDSAATGVEAAPQGGAWVRAIQPNTDSGMQLVFRKGMVHDGRFANNGWLMELPEPITKLTWDNAALMSVATAEQLGVRTKGVVQVSANGSSVELPTYVVPGMADGTIVVSVGYGRTSAGRVGNGAGVDVNPLRSTERFWSTDAQVEATGRYVDKLADTQDHFVIDRGLPESAATDLGQDERDRRADDFIREAELTDYKHDPEHALHHGHAIPDIKLWSDVTAYDGYKWAMSIDLNACTGCSTCVIACQAENNIPVVGKEEVWRGREMHWLRVDRYFSGDVDDPRVVHQPLPCQHCENAPCEQVCPVAATVHDEEGLNVMVYNRCIGTRYCSNNCPFKVRRFNYFNNHKNEDSVEVMVYNPEVTVRARGVMEKCTFCVQRIAKEKITAKNERRRVEDGAVVPACAQACPTDAIQFGDLNDPESRVHALADDPRRYTLLDVVNVKPRVSYLGRIKNSNPSIAGHGDGAHTEETPHHG